MGLGSNISNVTGMEVAISSSNGRETVNTIVSKRPDPNVGLSGNGSRLDREDPILSPATPVAPDVDGEVADPSVGPSREVDNQDEQQLRSNKTNLNFCFLALSPNSSFFSSLFPSSKFDTFVRFFSQRTSFSSPSSSSMSSSTSTTSLFQSTNKKSQQQVISHDMTCHHYSRKKVLTTCGLLPQL